ncbi:MAG TPA: adenylate/guanylate cyclase domain-containing protein, partial [Thermodesulfobacteriota bacterium]|nr:adenylate/guanylate cyclase domain-containing protein [Thermodesulfobacteriota bacterium]
LLIVAVDRYSSRELGLPEDFDEWPRHIYARLTEILTRHHAAAVAFDIVFRSAGDNSSNQALSKALSASRNTVLCEYLEKENLPLTMDTCSIRREHLVSPPSELVQSVTAIAPFILPRNPGGVCDYWTFLSSMGDKPTLPIVVFQLLALTVHDSFYMLLEQHDPVLARQIPRTSEDILSGKGVIDLIRASRALFIRNPRLLPTILQRVPFLDIPDHEKRMLRSLLKAYGGTPFRYINYYGPPGTISTIPIYRILNDSPDPSDGIFLPDLTGAIVFVGCSETSRVSQEDTFHTVFSTKDGIFLSGVEIAASACANLLEDITVQPVNRTIKVSIVFFWGTLLACGCWFLTPVRAWISIGSLVTLYVLFAFQQFSTQGIWYPLIFPLVIQTPATFVTVILLKYLLANRRYHTVLQALRYYLPPDMAEKVALQITDPKASGEAVYGACLCTDAERYTTVAESMDPEKLRTFLNTYYESLFYPIRRYHGIISDITGDSMLALWTASSNSSEVRISACMAALEIDQAVRRFHSSLSGTPLPTRTGIHFGEMHVGHIGALEHYEYRAVGDCINTVSRIQSLNKFLGTRILASEQVVEITDLFLVRNVGSFLFFGKSRPQTVFELLCLRNQAAGIQIELCSLFSHGLEAYRRHSWLEAQSFFKKCLSLVPDDGPSRRYSHLCEQHAHTPPPDDWSGTIHLDVK